MYSDLLFMPEKIKNEKCKKRLGNMHENKIFVIHIKALKQTDANKIAQGYRIQSVSISLHRNEHRIEKIDQK